MPPTDEFAGLGDEARDVLPPDEQLLALTTVEVAFGWTGSHDPDFRHSKTGRRMLRAAHRAADAVERAKIPRWLTRLGMVVGGVFSWAPSLPGPGRLFRTLIGGQVLAGEPASLARALQAELTPYGSGDYLAITDRALYLLESAPVLSKRLVSDKPPVWSAPADTVAIAEPAPRGPARARFALVFTDGSRIVLSGFPSHTTGAIARRVAAALGG